MFPRGTSTPLQALPEGPPGISPELNPALSAINAITPAAHKGVTFNSSNSAATYDLTDFSIALAALPDAPGWRGALGLGTMATQTASDVAITGGTITGLGAPLVSTEAATKGYVDGAILSQIAAIDVEIFKGGLNCSANPNYPAADAGNVYRVSAAGKIGGASGPNVEVNDRLECIADGTGAGDHATVGASWFITQANIDGAVVGPVSAIDGTPAVFDGTTGRLIKNIAYAAFKTLLALVKGDVGLGNVDNTADTAKPVSTAQQAALDLKANLASPSLTGTPTAPTAAVDTNTTQIATTAMVLAQAASATPIVDGTGTAGTSTRFARADHVHPSDTSRAPLASPTFTGTPAAPTAAANTNTTQIATTAFTTAAVAAKGATLASFDANKGGTVQTGIPDTTPTKLTYTTAAYNIGGYYDAANSKFTPPAGKYLIEATAYMLGTFAVGAAILLSIYKNGARYKDDQVFSVDGSSAYAHVFSICDANGTDYFEIFVSADTSSGTSSQTGLVNSIGFFAGVAL